MLIELYKLRQGKVLSGVFAGLAHKFGWDVWLARVIFLAGLFLGRIPLILIGLYIAAAYFLPYKEDRDADRYGTGPRKIKKAEKIDKSWFE
ncbi:MULTISPECIES: PspC domain-containing protein [Streptococcus]|uniref:PspC domain-containing protein n=1 Tax=Streptococcus ruminantium TaxID=1917441 RepID=A0ABU1B232_9STRE|nr:MULTISPECIES: PspC domain-containing protein [Streptococcus]MDQ8759489.1 PspC domain-containing protein [Streptococcus ruminantium]MDQ8764381.1 PspC domain-containing protein [Streptococcus ruminantium]MDQ8767107.1 PspC domain-containing protein [Streptococcus ruminantium]MDQ8768503.1 PspC domain-containing protein [Streptococcus ruminantium]MDQ8774376.1 PspC domain-containing protein [Streptococcus ruminantium]